MSWLKLQPVKKIVGGIFGHGTAVPLLVFLISCTPQEPKLESLSERGRRIYISQCTTCHAPNPVQDGSVGPAIAGSSKELLETHVLYGTYPEGYTPKRKTKMMSTFPHLKNEIEALQVFLTKPHKTLKVYHFEKHSHNETENHVQSLRGNRHNNFKYQ